MEKSGRKREGQREREGKFQDEFAVTRRDSDFEDILRKKRCCEIV